MLKEETKEKLRERVFGAAYFAEIMDGETHMTTDEWALLRALDALFGNTPEIDGQLKHVADACAQKLLEGYVSELGDEILDIDISLAQAEAERVLDVAMSED